MIVACIIIGIFIIIIIFMLIFILKFLYWFLASDYGDQKIKFKTFKAFYNINPDRWRLEENSVAFYTSKYYCGWNSISTMISYRFGFIDYYRYRSFYELIQYNKLEQDRMRNDQILIEEMKKEIKLYEERCQSEMNKKLQNIWDIK